MSHAPLPPLLSPVLRRLATRMTSVQMGHLVAVGAATFGAVVVAATALHVRQLHGAAQADAEGRLRTLSRVASKETNRILADTERLLAATAPRLARTLATDPAAATALLEAAAQQQLLVRELAMVGPDGRVLASSSPRSIGTKPTLPAWPDAGARARPGTRQGGRGLADATEPSPDPSTGFFTLSAPAGAGPPGASMVAVIGVDSLLNELRFVIGAEQEALALYRYDGVPLAASAPAAPAERHPVFRRFLPQRESGGYRAAGPAGAQALAHFDTTSDFPVVVDARLDAALVTERWKGELVAPVLVMTLALLALALYTMATLRVVRRQAAIQQQLAAARDAAEAGARAKANFLAMMSHELRTPMGAIIGLAELLSDTTLAPEQRRLVDLMHGSAGALLTVLNDVLDFSKIEAGKLDVERLPFDPAALVRDVSDLMAVAASRRGNTLAIDVAGAGDGPVLGDAVRVRQVLLNFVSNAVKFTERGRVEIALTRREGPGPGSALLRFEVRDSGVGIAPQALQRLFQPFEQGDPATTRRFGGTGLGLAISRRLVEAMDGRIGVASAPGQGSTFWFELPLPVAAAADAPAGGRDASAPRGGLRVLLAEDNPVNELILTTRLRRDGFVVEAVVNGRLALQALQRAPYDLVLMDMQMPEMDGESATRAIRALDGPLARVPIVGLSADALPALRQRYMGAGLDAYLTKPVDWDELHRVLARLRPAVRGADGAAAPAHAPPTPAASSAPPGPSSVPGASSMPGVSSVPGASAGSPATSSPSNPSTPAQLRATLGAANFARLLAVFWARCASDLAACREAVDAGDAERRRAAAHSLKGAAAGLRLAAVAEAAARLERCAPAEAPEALGGLVRVVEQARAELARQPQGAEAPSA